MHEKNTEALLKLVLCGGRAACRRRLLDTCGQPFDAITASPRTWHMAGLSAEQVRAIRHPDPIMLDRSLEWLAVPGHHMLGWHDPDYPPLLRCIPSPPLALFIDGEPSRLWHPAVAVVGSRAATPGGREHAHAFSRQLAQAGIAVISGMAAGIDTAAHQAVLAVDGGITLAVVGTGLDIVYPRQNAGLHERIATTGAVVSEHAPGTEARPSHFPSRNRILAGLALGLLVVEAGERSGALITARQAADSGREVFAIPGSIRNPMARGCHRLIRDGAVLVESAAEVLAGIAPAAGHLATSLLGGSNPLQSGAGPPPETHAPALAPEHQRLWQALGHDPTPMDSLVERTGLTVAELSSMLLSMELDGRVAVEHGRYTRKP